MIEWFTTILTAIQSNPIVAGLFGTTVFAGFVMSLRGIPQKIFYYLLNYFTVEIIFDQNNKVDGFNQTINQGFELMFFYLMKTKYFTFSKKADCLARYENRRYINSTSDIEFDAIKRDTFVLKGDFTPAVGTVYYTFINGTLVRFYLTQTESKFRREFILNVRFFTRKYDRVKSIVYKILNDCERKRLDRTTIEYLMNSGSRWSSMEKTPQYSQNIFMLNENQQQIYKNISVFLNSADKFLKLCKPYHTGYIFYGNPGCGKSQFVKKLAEDFELNVYILNLACTMTDSGLIELLQSTIGPAIVLIEDIDRYSFTGEIRGKKKPVPTPHDRNVTNLPLPLLPEADVDNILNDLAVTEDEESGEPREISFSTVLNIIDGIYGQDSGLIFIATTNHIDKLDPAFIRPGRFDYKYEFTYMNKKEICNFLHIQYGNNNPIYIRSDISLPISIVSNTCFECSSIEECSEKLNSL